MDKASSKIFIDLLDSLRKRPQEQENEFAAQGSAIGLKQNLDKAIPHVKEKSTETFDNFTVANAGNDVQERRPASRDDDAALAAEIALQIFAPATNIPLDIVSFDFALEIQEYSASQLQQVISDSIKHARKNQLHKLSIAINPPQFGHLDIELIVSGSKIKRINITTPSEEVLKILINSINTSALLDTLHDTQENAPALHFGLQNGSNSSHHDQDSLPSEAQEESIPDKADRIQLSPQATSAVDIVA